MYSTVIYTTQHNYIAHCWLLVQFWHSIKFEFHFVKVSSLEINIGAYKGIPALAESVWPLACPLLPLVPECYIITTFLKNYMIFWYYLSWATKNSGHLSGITSGYIYCICIVALVFLSKNEQKISTPFSIHYKSVKDCSVEKDTYTILRDFHDFCSVFLSKNEQKLSTSFHCT